MKIPTNHAVGSPNPRRNLKHICRLIPVFATLLALILMAGLKVQATPTVTLTRVHSFGDPLNDASSPQCRLTEGSDGVLYGTTTGDGAGFGTLFRVNKDGTGFAVLKGFHGGMDGDAPVAGVTEGSDGAFYGTTYQGGAFGSGTVFRMNKDGTGFAVLKSFSAATDGQWIIAGVIEGGDGALYGTARYGGAYASGTVFRLNRDGSGFTVLKSFNFDTEGGWLYSGVIEASDGGLYGTAYYGGSSGAGTVFRLNKDGNGFTVLKSFIYGTDGGALLAGVTEGSDGVLYGTTSSGGASDAGTVFRMNKDGSGFAVLKSLTGGTDGRHSHAVTEGSDGALYGTTYDGGAFGAGTLFRLNKDGTGFAVVKSFSSATDGGNLAAGVTEGSDGAFYGTTYQGGDFGVGTLFRVNKDGSSFAVIKSLNFATAGGNPWAGVTEGSDGVIYGTTPYGGANGSGTVFRLNKDGSGFAVLKSLNGLDGRYLYGEVTEGSNGALYGTASGGGTYDHGTVFRLNKDGSGFAVLKSLDGGSDGGTPYAAVTEGNDGALYGTTVRGGAFGLGTVFRINNDGNGFAVLKSFNGLDGGALTAKVIQGSDGALYGTAQFGGADGAGTAFRMNTDGTGFALLKSFSGWLDGSRVFAGLTEGSDGALYGTTYQGKEADNAGNAGTVFRVNKDGSGFVVLKTFGSGTDGFNLFAGVTEGSDGALYGTTYLGGSAGFGMVFRLNKDGSGFEVLRSLGTVSGEPQYPAGKLLLGSDSRWYGTSERGGDMTIGTVFALQICTPNQPPSLVSISPLSATANGTGFTLTVNGNNFGPTMTAYWNGSARPTTYVSPTQVTAQIPASDLANFTDIQTVNVTVGGPTSPESAAAIFAIIPASVGEVQASVVPEGQTGTVLSPPRSSTEPGVTLAIQNNGGGSVTAVAATYDTKPTGQTVFKVDSGSFVDVQFTGADSSDVAIVNFYYPASITGGAENKVKLRYFDGANWIPVLSSGGVVPVKNTTDNLDGTVSGGRFTVTFDNTSTPKITDLHGTIFGIIDPAPQVVTVNGPTIPLALGTSASVSVTYATPDPAQVCQVTFAWDDGSTTVVIGNNGSATTPHQYAAAGVYGVTVTVTDADGYQGSSKFEYIVIFDPTGGFVTGGGWINSPAGAYVATPALTGKATFGFVSKYQKGKTVPTGETEFQFHATNFTFNSTAYEWLVVSGALAQYKGSGTVNGTGNYGFLLTATDGQISGGGGVDKFRIKVWNKVTGAVVYDNVLGTSDDINSANPQALGGGSIVIQKAK